ncbi:aldo/keto reductase [Lentisphaerota bacterium WC36G]|nr:aldo/keto reductase [Lentisphaerae bacterium WC36]
MKYVEFGNTKCTVSKVGFGGMRFDLKKSEQDNIDLVKYAFEKGINYFDTAPHYCEGLSEIIMGKALKDFPRDNFYVTSKIMPTEIVDAEDAYNRVRESLSRLQVDYIDFFHVWCLRKIEHYHLAMQPNGLYEALLRAKNEGLIRHIVCSSHQPSDEIIKVVENDDFEAILLGTNILNFPYRHEGILEAKKHNMGVVVMNPLAGGAIPQNEDKFSFLCKGAPHLTPTEAALRFTICNKNIDVSLNGFSEKEHIDMACKIADNELMVGLNEIKQLTTDLGTRFSAICTACGYCDMCPKEIAIPAFMQYYNEKIMFDLKDEEMVNELTQGFGVMSNSKGQAKDCISCGLCEKKCTQHLPIMKRLKEINTWFDNFNKKHDLS